MIVGLLVGLIVVVLVIILLVTYCREGSDRPPGQGHRNVGVGEHATRESLGAEGAATYQPFLRRPANYATVTRRYGSVPSPARDNTEQQLRLSIHIERKSYRQATAKWQCNQPPDKWMVILENVNTSKKRENIFQFGVRQVDFQETLRAGNRYRVTVKALKVSTVVGVGRSPHYVNNFRIVGENFSEFRADLTVSEIRQLHYIALSETDASTTCKVLYRNKSPEYFADTFYYNNGVMKTELKDHSGDPASPINGQLHGLFFMAEVERWSSTGEPCRASPFGSTRLIVPVRVMFNLAPNLYFADFYCMKGQSHYVTLVMTREGSVADQFCQNHLLSLSIHDRTSNPFLFQGDGGEMKVACVVKVEVFFTENIDVNDLISCSGAVIKENIPLIGRGHTTPGGVPKNPDCDVCNLYPSSPRTF